jgi:TP901 family phage tail tape measure protein
MALQQAGLEWINQNLGPFLSELDKGNKGMAGIGDSAGETGNKFNLLGSVVTGVTTAVAGAVIDMGKKVGGAMVGIAKDSIDMAAEFQSAESRLEIAAGAAAGAAEQYGGLGKVALAVGGDTRLLGVSATGAADAMTGLLKAGIPLEDVMGDLNKYMDEGAELGGILRASIDLAAATELDMVAASDLASVSMATFGLTAEETNAAMDYMVRAADASVAEVSGLRDAMVNVGASANAMGFSFEEVNTALAVLSTRGIQGAEAGTALKSMMTNLMRTTPAVTEALESNGIALYDNEGKMYSMVELIAQFQVATESMTEAQRNQFVQTVAGTYGMKTMNTLLDEGVEGWMKMEEGIAGATGIQEQAAKASETYAAQLEALMGNLETLKIGIGTPFLNAMAKVFGAFSSLIDRYGPAVTGIMEKIGGAIESVIGALLEGDIEGLLETFNLDPSWANTFDAIAEGVQRIIDTLFGGPEVDFDAKFKLSSGEETVGMIDRIINTVQRFLDLVFGTEKSMDDQFRMSPTAGDETQSVVDKIIGAIESVRIWFDENGPKIQAVLMTIGQVFGKVFGTVSEVISQVWPEIQTAFEDIKAAFEEVGVNFGEGGSTIETVVKVISAVIIGAGTIISGVARLISGVVGGIAEVFRDMAETTSNIMEGWQDMIAGAREFFSKLFAGDIEGAIDGIEKAFKGLGKFLKNFGKQFVKAMMAPLKIVYKGVKGFIEGIIDFFKDLSKKLVGKSIIPDMMDAIKDVIERVWNAILDFIEDLLSDILETVERIWDDILQFITDTLEDIQTIVERIWNDILDFLEGLLSDIQTSVEQIWNDILSFLEGLLADIQDTVERVWNNILDFLEGVLSDIGTAIETQWNNFLNTIEQALDDIQTAVETIWNSIQTTIETILGSIQTTIETIWGSIQTTIDTILGAIQTTIETIWGGIQTTIETVTSSISTTIDTVFAAIQTTIDTVMNAIGGENGIVPRLWAAIQTTFETVTTSVQTTVETVFGAIQTAIDTVMNAIGGEDGIIPRVWGAIQGVFESVIGTTEGTGIWGTVKTAFNAILTKITNIMGTATTGVWGIIKSVWETISGVFETVIGTAANDEGEGGTGILGFVTRGFYKIKTGITTVMNGISTVINTVWTAIKGFFTSGLNAIIAGVNAFISILNDLITTVNTIFGLDLSTLPTIPPIGDDTQEHSAGGYTPPTIPIGDQLTSALASTLATVGVLPTAAAGGGAGGGQVNLTVGPNYISDEMDMEVFGARVRQIVSEAI